MRRTFLRDCAAGDILEDVLVITNKQLAAARDGKYYIKGVPVRPDGAGDVPDVERDEAGL
jgi:hypothetical protein